jgi:membrane-associated protease RseP (regulator of RpoE activity)
MRRSDDVFFFTLIDFLLQVFFFGLLMFVVGQLIEHRKDSERAKEDVAKRKVLELAGVSSLTELTDYLSKLVPLDHLRGTKEFVDRNGGPKEVKAAIDAVREAGGVEKVKELQQQVDGLTHQVAQLEGWGKVSCIPNVRVGDKYQPKSVARVVVYDDKIVLEDPSPEMKGVLASLGLEFSSVQQLSPSSFRATFAPLVAKHPECRYFLSRVVHTKYLDPMNAVWSAFRTQ